MRIRQILQVAAILSAIISAGCDRGGASGKDVSTDVNLSDDAAADDVLGANEAAANGARTP